MTDEQLQQLLAAASDAPPEEEEIDPAWQLLRQGDLSDEALASLDDSLVEAAREALTPLEDGFLEDVAANLPPLSPPAVQAEGPSFLPAVANSPWRWALPVLVAAAAALFVFVLPGEQAALEYSLAVQGGDQLVRGDTLPSQRYSDGGQITLLLRPPSEAIDAVDVYVALDSWEQQLEVAPEFSENGAVRIHGEMGTPPWVLSPGEHTLLIGIGPEGEPFSPEPPWQIWEQVIELVP